MGESPIQNGYYLCKVIVMKTSNYVWTEPKILYWEDNVWLENPKTFKIIRNENILLWMKVPDEFLV